jgi:hypothetical protein
MNMKWLYRGLMAASMVGGALVTGGILPIMWAGVFAATGTAAGLFHETPGAGK